MVLPGLRVDFGFYGADRVPLVRLERRGTQILSDEVHVSPAKEVLVSGLPELPAGVYRHYKGHLYLVLGYAQNATNDEDGKIYVVYVGLQTDGQPSPMRMRLRQVDEFWGTVRNEALDRWDARFTYVGTEAW